MLYILNFGEPFMAHHVREITKIVGEQPRVVPVVVYPGVNTNVQDRVRAYLDAVPEWVYEHDDVVVVLPSTDPVLAVLLYDKVSERLGYKPKMVQMTYASNKTKAWRRSVIGLVN